MRAGLGMAVGQPGDLEIANDRASLVGREAADAFEEGRGVIVAGGSDEVRYASREPWTPRLFAMSS